jgi:hypothetical protein
LTFRKREESHPNSGKDHHRSKITAIIGRLPLTVNVLLG